MKRFHARRSELARTYSDALRGMPLILPPEAPPSDTHAWHLYVVRLTDECPISRDAFIEEMARGGIGCSVHFIPLHIHPYWRDTYALRPESYPQAYEAFTRAVSLPLYTKMTSADQVRVIDQAARLLRKVA